LALGCVQSFDPASQIQDLRILAVSADPPEAAPGETVQLSALVADPSGQTLPATLAWLVCFPDAVNGVEACATGGTPQDFLAFGTAQTQVTIPGDLVLLPEGDPEAQNTVLLTVLACTSFNPEDCFSCDDEGICDFGGENAEVEVAVKRIIVSQRPAETRNHNPDLVNVFAQSSGGDFVLLDPVQPTPLDVCGGLTLRSEAGPESAEVFTELQFGEPVEITEQINTAFFITRGAVGSDRVFNGLGQGVEPGIADNSFNLKAGDTSDEPFSVFFVLRDDRGGAEFAGRVIQPTASCVQ
jgi:hypothetical protein